MKKDESVYLEEMKKAIILSKKNLDKSIDLSLQYANEAIDYSNKIGNIEDRVEAFMNIANIYIKQNNFSEALKYHEKALEMLKKTDKEIEIANVLSHIGVIYSRLGKYEDALEYNYKSLAIKEKLEDKIGIGRNFNNIGILYKYLHQYDKAQEYYFKALQVFQEVDSLHDQCFVYNNIGVIYRIKKEFKKALEYHQLSLQVSLKINDLNGIAIAYNNLGNCHRNLNDVEKSSEYFKKGLEIRERMGDKRAISVLKINLANIYMIQDKIKLALQEANTALEIAKEIGINPLLQDCYGILKSLYSLEKNYEMAFHYSELFSAIKDKIFSDESNKKIAEMQTKYETEKKEREAEIYKLKNIELVEANQQIKEHQDHIQLITKILRHDLRNNLTVINSAIKLFFRRQDSSFLQEAQKKITKSNILIDKMKELEILINKNQNLKPFQLTEVLTKVLKNYESKNIETSIKKALIVADDSIFSVFDNIISNAFNHGQTDKVKITMQEKHDDLIVNIIDYGIGIPDKIKEKIFEESFKYGKTGNTGLGLFIVKKAITCFGGEVYVEDNSPQGSIFRLRLKKVG